MNITSMIFNFIFFPLLFMGIGVLIKLRDKNFKLSNAFALGVLMAVFMSMRMFLGMS